MLNYIKTKLKNQVIRMSEWRDAYLFHKYKKKALIPFDENWFKGKRVAIIGGADSAYKEKLGEYIDAFDVVVRVNNGVRVIEKYKEYVGKRTDFLFHTFYENVKGGGGAIELDLWDRLDVKNIIFSHNWLSNYGIHLRSFIIKTKGLRQIGQVEKSLCDDNMNIIYPYHPTTGLIAINTVYNCKPSQIYVTGITFFRTAHHQDYRQGSLEHWTNIMKSDASKHNPDAEYKYFKRIYNDNKDLFTLDSTLQQIIDTDNE